MRIIVKVGTNLLTAKDGSLNALRMGQLSAELSELIRQGHEVLIVSSGAIGAGMGKLGLKKRPTELREKQALAAIGQPLLMDAWQSSFSRLGHPIAQVLLTRQDFDDRSRYLNARNTLHSLLSLGTVPIINENDTVAVEEINFGDNDTLAALVAATVHADWLFIFTDVDGLYKGLPGKSEMIPVVERITPEIEGYASGVSGSGKGVGGMKTKLAAARIAASAGVKLAIVNGGKRGILGRVLNGEPAGTVFLPRKPLESRKCWIAFGRKPRGRIFIDGGAAQAIVRNGKSLLPSGITGIEGRFAAGDTVTVVAPDNREVARGLVQVSSDDLGAVKGRRTSDLGGRLPSGGKAEVIHRDNLVIL